MASVRINVPYLMEIVEKSGKNRTAFSRDVLLRADNYITGVIKFGTVSPMMVDVIAKVTGADRKRLLSPVPYDQNDYFLRKISQPTKKEGTIAEYVQLMSEGMEAMAKHQKSLGDLTVEISKLTVDNRRFSEETGKLLQIVLSKLNRMEKNLDEIHKQLK